MIHNLVGQEQNGFLPGRSAYDNIIAAQEIAHTSESNSPSLPRMILKIDIEKAFDTLEWIDVLATLRKMNFPDKWISWIQATLSSTSFSFIVNDQRSSWISSSHGVRQGDPLSSLLFLLTSQTLTTILNKALHLNMIQGFSNSLSRNFNHLIFADDLILVTSASRKSC